MIKSTFERNPELTALQKRIIKAWEKTIVVHPSQQSIADKLGCSQETVQRTIRKYLVLKKKGLLK